MQTFVHRTTPQKQKFSFLLLSLWLITFLWLQNKWFLNFSEMLCFWGDHKLHSSRPTTLCCVKQYWIFRRKSDISLTSNLLIPIDHYYPLIPCQRVFMSLLIQIMSRHKSHIYFEWRQHKFLLYLQNVFASFFPLFFTSHCKIIFFEWIIGLWKPQL